MGTMSVAFAVGIVAQREALIGQQTSGGPICVVSKSPAVALARYNRRNSTGEPSNAEFRPGEVWKSRCRVPGHGAYEEKFLTYYGIRWVAA